MQNRLMMVAGPLLLGWCCLVGLDGCSKENNVSADSNVGSCNVPAGTCPEGFSPEVTGEGTVEECEQDGEGTCKKVGSCTVRCVDPRGCTSEGSVCGDGQPACCGESAGTHNCVNFVSQEVQVCSKRCTASTDCPGTCCDAAINQGAFAVCAPYEVCASTTLPQACLSCLEIECPDDLAACREDDVCAACLEGDMFPSSPECRANGTLTRGYGCALQNCPDDCQM